MPADSCQCCRKPPVARYFPGCSWVPSKFESGPSVYPNRCQHGCSHEPPSRAPSSHYSSYNDNHERSQFLSPPGINLQRAQDRFGSMSYMASENSHSMHQNHSIYHSGPESIGNQTFRKRAVNEAHLNVNKQKQTVQNNSLADSAPSAGSVQKAFNSLHGDRQKYAKDFDKPGAYFQQVGNSEHSFRLSVQSKQGINGAIEISKVEKYNSVKEVVAGKKLVSTNIVSQDYRVTQGPHPLKEADVCKRETKSQTNIVTDNPTDNAIDSTKEELEMKEETEVCKEIKRSSVYLHVSGETEGEEHLVNDVDDATPQFSELLGATCKELTSVGNDQDIKLNGPSCFSALTRSKENIARNVEESETNIPQNNMGRYGAMDITTLNNEVVTQTNKERVQTVDHELTQNEKELAEEASESDTECTPNINDINVLNVERNSTQKVTKSSQKVTKSSQADIKCMQDSEQQVPLDSTSTQVLDKCVVALARSQGEDCQSDQETNKEIDTATDTDNGHEDPYVVEPLDSPTNPNGQMPSGDEYFEVEHHQSKVGEVHLSGMEEVPISDKDVNSLPENASTSHPKCELEEATCASVEGNKSASGIDIRVASVASPMISVPSAGAKKNSIGAMCKELTHKLVAEVVLEETTEVITKRAPSLLASGDAADVNERESKVLLVPSVKPKCSEKIPPVSDVRKEQVSLRSTDDSSCQHGPPDLPLQAVIFENCVKVNLACASESLPVGDLLLPPPTCSAITDTPSQQDEVKQKEDIAGLIVEDERNGEHECMESLSADGGAAASPEDKSGCSASDENQDPMKEEQYMFLCDGEVFGEKPTQTVYLSGADINLTPPPSIASSEEETSKEENGEEGKYRSSWASNKSNEKTVSRTNRMYLDRAKVGTLRYLILQSPLVMCDVDISDDEESDVELDENGEVIQDYPLGYLPTYIVSQIFGYLCTRDLAALKCTCKDFRWLIERYNIVGNDSRWLESDGYRDDPCYQCGKIRDARGDVSLCRWHPKIYYKNGHIGRRYWTCCFALDEDAVGCQVGLHDNNWVLSGFKIRKVPRPWRNLYWRSYSSEMWW
ncbi:uncharacterized protein [Amphiura filiformis]|uniref:uncharacterized protein n=1 Tax=Amphiura filiformis TaxID=82378 RepID=UPI003B20F62B